MTPAPRIERLSEVTARTGLSRSTLYSRAAKGLFPRPIPLGSPHAVGWLADEVTAWINGQAEQRDRTLAAA